MKVLLTIVSFIFLGCAAANCPAPVTSTVYVDTGHDVTVTRTIYVDSVMLDTVTAHDTTMVTKTIVQLVAQPVTGVTDSTDITLYPVGGDQDDAPQLQAVINAGLRIRAIGHFDIYSPLIFTNFNGTTYGQASGSMIGEQNAQNAPDNAITIFTKHFIGPAIIIQQGKGVQLRNFAIRGMYSFPSDLNEMQVDTLTWNQWPSTGTPTNPDCGIAIDPFSDPANYDSAYQMYAGLQSYYVPGMPQYGSTAISIDGMQIRNCEVGVMITPSNQVNGDMIDVLNNSISLCKVAYAYTQAQSKLNRIINLQAWGGLFCVVDGTHYGFPHEDGSTPPFVDGISIAGGVHELFDVACPTFSGSFHNIYGESLWKLGVMHGSFTGIDAQDWQIDFDWNANTPSPDFILEGENIQFRNCGLRNYGQAVRLLLNQAVTSFDGGYMSLPPIIVNPYQCNGCGSPPNLPTFNRVSLFYTNVGPLSQNNYDSLYAPITVNAIINDSTHSGYFIDSVDSLVAYDQFLYEGIPRDDSTKTMIMEFGQIPPGWVASDTVQLINTGVNVHSGTYSLYPDRWKKSIISSLTY